MRFLPTMSAVILAVLAGCNKPQEPVQAVNPPEPTEVRDVNTLIGDDALAASEKVAPDPQPLIDPRPVPVLAQPTQPAQRTYVIQKGDTFMGIARKLYNNPARAKDIQAMNPTLDPRKLAIGQEILLPAN
ncbi:MAG: LysM peptidoglycan-binding domain-containing protein [Planctomycetes bacterium]|nr:LysM peptidoglycan-binding domain-containing protein [Planctomycetota bacterium]